MNQNKHKTSKEEKAKIVLAILRGDKTANEIAAKYGVHPNIISKWKQTAVDGLPELFEDKRLKVDRAKLQEQERLLDQACKLVGQRDMELDWLKKNYLSLMMKERLNLVDRESPKISLVRQAELLSISRSSLYYQAKISEKDLAIMNLIDSIYTDYPFYGKRRMATVLRRDYDIAIGKNHVRTLMIKMGLIAIYPKKKKDLSKPNKQHKIYPYLLRGLNIVRVNQVWSTDITYIKLEHGFCYLVAIIDWHSRYVISWELSNTLDIDFYLRALESAYEFNIPDILNTDQGSHFTSSKFTSISLAKGLKVSMDGRGRYLDNIFVERLWRIVKQEDIYIKQYNSVAEARLGLTKFFADYNNFRPHQSLDYKTPAEIQFNREYKKTASNGQLNKLNINLNTILSNQLFNESKTVWTN